jgi:hypothetical protein
MRSVLVLVLVLLCSQAGLERADTGEDSYPVWSLGRWVRWGVLDLDVGRGFANSGRRGEDWV